MRYAIICLLCLLIRGPAQSQPPEAVERARRSVIAALPELSAAAEAAVTMLSDVDTTALGCQLIAGLPLSSPIAAYRLEFALDGQPFAVHVSADGKMIQPCDERFPNLGAGAIPLDRARLDSDGDGLADRVDACPQIAGIPAMERAGCPQPSDGDRDGDGSPDARDRCPAQAGAAAAHGCALMRDEDGDGAPDHVDICAADFGIIRAGFALGCPADASGSSRQRRGVNEVCKVTGDAPIYAESATESGVIGQLLDSQERTVIGRAPTQNWYQLASGWVQGDGTRLSGACYNIPLVNAAAGGATGCFLRPSGDNANVRQGPGGTLVTRIYDHQSVAVLGQDFGGNWLFYRGGWVNRAVLELSGSCDQLPKLDPAQVASGIIHFCPPGYPGWLPSRIDIGEGNARIASHTIANRLRAQPDIAAEQVGEVPPRTVLDAVLDGPACKGPHIWWLVEAGGLIGWTVESDVNLNFYYLEPLSKRIVGDQALSSPSERAPSNQEQPATGHIIHSANAQALDTIKLLVIEAPVSVSWSPRGSELAIVTAGGSLERYRYPDLMRLPFDRESPAVSAIAYGPDAEYLAIGLEDGAVLLVALENDQTKSALDLGKLDGPIRALAWTRRGRQLAAISGDDSLKLARRAGTLKLWQIDPLRPWEHQLHLHYIFPYPLTALAFSADDQLLAVTGESTADRRAGLWIYRASTGELLYSKALAPGRGGSRVVQAPDRALGDFIYNSGDSLYQIEIESGADLRIYHQAGHLLPHFSFRRQVIPDAEALLASATIAQNGPARLRIANALNPHSPSIALSAAPASIAFSPDGRALAVAERERDRVLILGVTEP
ncbi:MAG: thrombospondin type 3 repeat-containing protein [Chloroflexi bacterium]|nr:thrombospondin type 3 repeat-containing protein [Chloroflexota bacterium]